MPSTVSGSLLKRHPTIAKVAKAKVIMALKKSLVIRICVMLVAERESESF
jgi:hypothetical protein